MGRTATSLMGHNRFHAPQRPAPQEPSVSDDELTDAISQSFTQASDARFRETIELSTDAALEAYDRVIIAATKLSRSRRSN
jgi:hypothetical protein